MGNEEHTATATTTALRPKPPKLQVPDGNLVAHVIIVAFHAQLGNRIEFAYPRLTGDALLKTPDLNDSLDISADPLSPYHSPRPYSTGLTPRTVDSPTKFSASAVAGARRGDWGTLPDEWRFLPFMALPEGVHDLHHDVVFFTLDPAVHCVSCFRQVAANTAAAHAHSASHTKSNEATAARGSVQKSVVLLCRRPLYGVLADRLAPAVRAYFEQGDFTRTDVLAGLFHSLNSSLARPSLRNAPTLFHGLDLRAFVRLIGPHALSVLKLVLLEKRVVFYSQPVALASNAVVAFASIFPGALDSVAPTMTPLDTDDDARELGLPLALFGPLDRVAFQPYAPLPHISELLQPNARDEERGCLIATSHNVGVLLSSAAVAKARERSASPAPRTRNTTNQLPVRSQSVSVISASTNRARPHVLATPPRGRIPADSGNPNAFSRSLPQLGTTQQTQKSTERKPRRPTGRLPVVDALVNLSTGKVSVSGALEPIVRTTKLERRFMRDLVAAAAAPSSASVSASGATGSFVGSDDYVRSRLRAYLTRFLSSVAVVEGVVGGPPGGPHVTWQPHEVQRWDLSPVSPYAERFARKWLTTRNAAVWARAVDPDMGRSLPPPAPEVVPESQLEEGVAALPAALQMPMDELVTGLRHNVAEFGKWSNVVSERAVQGLSSFFRRMEHEVTRVETAIGKAGSGAGRAAAMTQKTQNSNQSNTQNNPKNTNDTIRLSKSEATPKPAPMHASSKNKDAPH